MHDPGGTRVPVPFSAFPPVSAVQTPVTRKSRRGAEKGPWVDSQQNGVLPGGATERYAFGYDGIGNRLNSEIAGTAPTPLPSSTTQNRWLHSDFKNAALPYVYQMYEAMIAKGSLK